MKFTEIKRKARSTLLTDIGTNNGSARNEWIRKTLKDLPKGIRILDAGAGELQFKDACSHLEYVSQDFGQYDGSGDGKGIQMKKWDNSKLDIVSDIVDIPVPDKSFDAILCVEVFEHIADPISAIKEFSRILKPGGIAIITSPFCSMTHFAPYHFYSGFNRYFYQTNLEKHGFKIREMASNGSFYDYVAQDIKSTSFVTKQYCGKEPNVFQKLVLLMTLRVLHSLKKKDTNSNELLCFGYQVVAIKQ